MRTTAEILETLEPAAFEKLSGEALRHLYPSLLHLIPSGINAAGKTIVSPFDGFCFSEPNHFVMFQATTNASNLRVKWLSEGKEKGDLIKSISEANTIRGQYPSFRFSVYLVSNGEVDRQLHIDVKAHDSDDFTAVIVEQRELVSFLDHNAEGQYLRKKYLGIDADRISGSLLMDIAKENLQRFATEIYLDEADVAVLPRHKQIEEQVAQSRSNVNLLIAESGSGKSTICFALIHQAQANGKVSMRIKPGIVEAANSIEDALYRQLVDDFPKLYVDPIEIQNLLKDALLIIDDINKSANAPILLDRIISWSAPREQANIQIVCPVWPRNLAALDNLLKKESRVESIRLQQLNFEDCKTIIKKRALNNNLRLTDQEIHFLIVDNGFDPLLIGISLDLIEAGRAYSGNTAAVAISNFVDEKIRQLHSRYHYPESTIKEAFVILGVSMLRFGKMDIRLTDIHEWTESNANARDIIIQAAAERQLFFFDTEGRCFFRHDRVRDHILVLATVAILTDFSLNGEILADPYFAEITGAAISQKDVIPETLVSLIGVNPLAVFMSLKYLQAPESTTRFNTIATVIKHWNETGSTHKTPKEIAAAIGNALAGFDTRDIGQLTFKMTSCKELNLARFRNGDWRAATFFFAGVDYFYPTGTTYWWYIILAHVKSTYQEKIVRGLSKALSLDYKIEGIQHAYTLAGFMEDPKLIGPLVKSWELYAGVENYLSYLWAILKCFTPDDAVHVKNAMVFWNTLSEEAKGFKGNRSPWTIPSELKSIDLELTPEKLAVIIGNADESVLEITAPLLSYIDSPEAMKIVLELENQLGSDEDMRSNHWDERWDRDRTRRRLSQATLDFLELQFRDRSTPEARRYVAWKYWTGNEEPETVMKCLQEIREDDTTLFRKSVYWRIGHGDTTAFAALTTIIPEKPWLVRMLDTIWNDETKEYMRSWIAEVKKANDEDRIGYVLELIARLNNAEAEQMLTDGWEVFSKHKDGIGAALFLSTAVTRELAAKEIKRLDPGSNEKLSDFYDRNLDGLYITVNDPNPLSEEQQRSARFLGESFKHMHMHFFTRYQGKPERVTREKIEGLLPYFKFFDSLSLHQFASDCRRFGFNDLLDKIFPHLPKYLHHKFRLNDEDLLHDIVMKYRELEKNDSVAIAHWIEELDKLGVNSDMVAGALDKLWEMFQNGNAFFIACLILEQTGTRKEIPLLERMASDPRITGPEEDRYKIKYWMDNTIFCIKRRGLN